MIVHEPTTNQGGSLKYATSRAFAEAVDRLILPALALNVWLLAAGESRKQVGANLFVLIATWMLRPA